MIEATFRQRLAIVREDTSAPVSVLNSMDAVLYLRDVCGLDTEWQEVCIVMFLDRRLRIIGHQEIGRGGIAHAPMEPREVLVAALHANAAGVLVAHNHPSGASVPSADDIALTRPSARRATSSGWTSSTTSSSARKRRAQGSHRLHRRRKDDPSSKRL
jgi:DNA repair protein RadC